MRRFREIKEVRNEKNLSQKIALEKRLARLDEPMYEDSERDDESLIGIIGEYEFNRRRLDELNKRLEELDTPLF